VAVGEMQARVPPSFSEKMEAMENIYYRFFSQHISGKTTKV
jgi:hypothetical protein